MITPQELQDKKFVKAVFGGYDMREVDDFLDSILNDYEQLYKENAVLKGKLKVLAERVEEYRSVDNEMRKALLEAKRSAEAMLSDAEKSSQETLTNAKEEAERETRRLRDEIVAEEKRLAAAQSRTAAYVSAAAQSCEAHINGLQDILKMHIEVTGPADDAVETAALEIESHLGAASISAGADDRQTSTVPSAAQPAPPESTEQDRRIVAGDTIVIPPVSREPFNFENESAEINVGGVNIQIVEMDMTGSKDEHDLSDIFRD